MPNTLDYLIIGQGLTGSALAWELIRRGKSVMVLDEPQKNIASNVAAGMCNPITGKMMAKAWKAETIFPQLERFYTVAGDVLKKKFFSAVHVYRPFASVEERQQWSLESNVDKVRKFVSKVHATPVFTDQVINPFGGVEIAGAGCLNTSMWLSSVRDFLVARDSFRESHFEESELSGDEILHYKEFSAQKIVFCNGLAGLASRWFGWLPLIPLKGETLGVKIQSPPHRIYSRGVYLVPSSVPGIYKAGATYQHVPFADGISHQAREELEIKLKELVSIPFEVVHQEWGIRPTTPDRRPLLGFHPRNKNIIILNGLGTKGVSLAPYLANLMADWMEGQGDLAAEVNIYRFKALYSG